MERPHLIDRTAAAPAPESSMRVLEYLLAALALVAALLLGLAH